ncbi:MAG: hypothetical protein IKH43_02915 [Bacteroidaceae bacterium]|nr:hypothetical protein [Bacteroidaceae bacterium]
MSLNVKHIYSSAIKTLLMVSSMSLLMTACSEDSSDMQEDRDVLQIIPFTRPFTDEGQLQRRAIQLPTNYDVYTNLYPQASSAYASIHAYLIANNAVNTQGDFVYNKDELQMTGDVITKTGWSSDISIRQGTNYFVYGFMPESFSSSASISQNEGSYENKAIININGVDAVTPADVCVVTGVKGFDTPITETTDGSVELGNFSYTGKEKDKNYIYLLLDHLFACINLEYTVDAEYSKWRKIILREVTIAPSDNTPKRNLTVTINGGSYEVSDTEVTGSISGSANVYNEPNATGYIPIEGVTPLSVPGYFTPTLNSAFKITSTYDVYDTENNPVRVKCTAENKLQLNVTDPARGNCYTVKFVITPTYLYQLSEPDLDNPTISVGS